MFSFSILPTVFATYFTLLLVLSFPFFYGSDLSYAFLTLLFPLFACVAIFALPTFLALTGAAFQQGTRTYASSFDVEQCEKFGLLDSWILRMGTIDNESY